MSIISRECINNNIKIKSLRLLENQVESRYIDYHQLIELIDRCKTYLKNVKQVTPGQKVILSNFYWPEYLGWFYACSELGLSFLISDYPRSKVALKKLEIYGDIDWVIYDDHCPEGFADWKDKIIGHHEILSIIPDKSISTYAQPTDILLYATTSGTSGTPKIVKYTHEFFYKLLERNANLYNLKNSDRCFHSKNLHHGSVLGVYFLPTLKYCEYHFHSPFRYVLIKNQEKTLEEVEGKLFEAWVNMIQKEKINKILLFFDQIDVLKKYLKIENKIHDDLTAYVLTKISDDDINVLVKQFKYKLISIFGCTETSGPLFLPEININNYQDYDPTNMKQPLDEFYKLAIVDGKLLVTMPSGESVCTGDKFEIVNNNWIYKGRDNLYRVNGHPIYLDLLNKTVEDITNLKKEKEFDIIIDSDANRIYIRVDCELDLKKLNQGIFDKLGIGYYFISKQLIGHRKKYFSGIKFDPETIRLLVRNE